MSKKTYPRCVCGFPAEFPEDDPKTCGRDGCTDKTDAADPVIAPSLATEFEQAAQFVEFESPYTDEPDIMRDISALLTRAAALAKAVEELADLYTRTADNLGGPKAHSYAEAMMDVVADLRALVLSEGSGA